MIKTDSRADFIEKVLREFLPRGVEIERLEAEPIPLIPTFEFRFTNLKTKHTDYTTLLNVLWYLGADIKKYASADGIVRAEV